MDQSQLLSKKSSINKNQVGQLSNNQSSIENEGWCCFQPSKKSKKVKKEKNIIEEKIRNCTEIVLVGDDSSDAGKVITSILLKENKTYTQDNLEINNQLEIERNFNFLMHSPIYDQIKLQRFFYDNLEWQYKSGFDSQFQNQQNILFDYINLDFEEYYAYNFEEQLLGLPLYDITILFFSLSSKDTQDALKRITNIENLLSKNQSNKQNQQTINIKQVYFVLTKSNDANQIYLQFFHQLCKKFNLSKPLIYPSENFHQEFKKLINTCLDDQKYSIISAKQEMSLYSDDVEKQIQSTNFDYLHEQILQKILNKGGYIQKDIQMEHVGFKQNLIELQYQGVKLIVKYYITYFSEMDEMSIFQIQQLIKEAMLLQKIQHFFKKEKKKEIRCCKIQSVYLKSELLKENLGYSCFFFIMPHYKWSIQQYINLHLDNNQSDQSKQYPFGDEIKYKWCIQLLETIVFLRENNIFHIDLKPDNIFVTPNKSIRIGDFGSGYLKKQISHNTWENNSSCLLITPVWSHPDQISHKISPNFDFWSYGCIVFYIFTLKRPFSDFTGDFQEIQSNIRGLVNQNDPNFFFTHHQQKMTNTLNQFKTNYEQIYLYLEKFFLKYKTSSDKLYYFPQNNQNQNSQSSINQEDKKTIDEFLKYLKNQLATTNDNPQQQSSQQSQQEQEINLR